MAKKVEKKVNVVMRLADVPVHLTCWVGKSDKGYSCKMDSFDDRELVDCGEKIDVLEKVKASGICHIQEAIDMGFKFVNVGYVKVV